MRYFQLTVAIISCIACGWSWKTAVAQTDRKLHSSSAIHVSSNYSLFAVLDGSRCAESLVYGPSPLSMNGSADGYSAYVCTEPSFKAVPHTEWLQVISFANSSVSPCRIHWTFDTPCTLEDHFTTAVKEGVQVSYSVECASAPLVIKKAQWWFSKFAGNTSRKFIVKSSTYGFSDRYGAWGTGHSQAEFWGVGNFDGFDENACAYFYRDGVITEAVRHTYMYFKHA